MWVESHDLGISSHVPERVPEGVPENKSRTKFWKNFNQDLATMSLLYKITAMT